MERWDALCGFVPGDEVHVARRAEDAAALAVLDATPVWLDFVEHSYLDAGGLGRRARRVVDALEAALRRPRPHRGLRAVRPRRTPTTTAPTTRAMLVRERILGRRAAPRGSATRTPATSTSPAARLARVARLFRSPVWPTPGLSPSMPTDARKLAAVDATRRSSSRSRPSGRSAPSSRAPAPEQYWRLDAPRTVGSSPRGIRGVRGRSRSIA